ncbi:hypothetical protein [Nocardiopsis suaedae]|uniref:Uncharacterized protein n=1 Tax=Nocardiopsis suaedae TaxID=3018444 RepID=A0ABT4TIY4_9ACTN|nr:hypothetical protein [Nocardiopsis suaedae]MDA2804556.1 hypothetical protein [Nocardiopsis suaedae]
MTPVPPRALPTTQDDLHNIERTAAAAVDHPQRIISAVLVPTGVYLRIHCDYTHVAADVLNGCGYTATLIRTGHILVSGVADRTCLLDAEINRLEAERRSLDEITLA